MTNTGAIEKVKVKTTDDDELVTCRDARVVGKLYGAGAVIPSTSACVSTQVDATTGEIDMRGFNTLTVFIDYTKGDETSFDLTPYVLHTTGGDVHQICYWADAATSTVTVRKFQLTATGKHYFVLDVTGIPFVKIYGASTGGTPTGVVDLSYCKTNN